MKINKSKNKLKKKQSIFEKVNVILLLVNPTINLLEYLNRGFKIKRIKINLKIAGNDACQTAIFYGKFCCFFYSLLKLVRSVLNLEIETLKIEPNFYLDETCYNLSFYMQLGVGRLVIGVVKYIFIIIFKILIEKIKNKNLNKKERLN